MSQQVRVGVKIKDRNVLNLLDAMEDPEIVLLAAGTEVKKLLQSHYREKNKTEPNKLGGKRTNFWADIGRSIDGPKPEAGRVVVSITDPRIRQKVYGGTIKPKNSKYLTIPLRPEAYDLRASVFEEETGIELSYVERGGKRFLGSSESGRFEAYYLLVASVTQEPWPGSLPSEKQLTEAAKKGAVEALLAALEAV